MVSVNLGRSAQFKESYELAQPAILMVIEKWSAAIKAPVFSGSTISVLLRVSVRLRMPRCTENFVCQPILALGICAAACGIIPASSRSADIVAGPAALDLETAGSRVAGNEEGDYSYLLTPFKLASQPNLKQSVFGFAVQIGS